MCAFFIPLLVLCIQALSVNCELIFPVPSLQKCKLSDSSCLKTQSQNALPILAAGMPEIGSEPLDIMKIDTIKVDLAGLNMAMRDVDVKGLKKAVLTTVRVDMEKKLMSLGWDVDISLKGKYKASGRLLILPISGDGDVNMKLKKLHVDMTIPFEVVKNTDGKDMLDLRSYKYKFDVVDGAHFHLTNLFNGNKLLSDAILKFMNENWKILSKEFGTPLMDKPNKKIYEAIRTYLKSQPLEDIVAL